MKITRYTIDAEKIDYGKLVMSQIIITSIRVKNNNFGHDIVTVFNRGGCSGDLIVDVGDGNTIAEMLIKNSIVPFKKIEEEY